MTSVPIAGNNSFSGVFSNQVAGITDYLNNYVNISDNSAGENAFNFVTGPIYIQTRPDLLKKQVVYTPLQFSNATAGNGEAGTTTGCFALLTDRGLDEVTSNFSTNNTCFTFPRNAIVLKATIEVDDSTIVTAANTTFHLYTNSGLALPTGPATGFVANLHNNTPVGTINTAGGASNEVGGGSGTNAPIGDGSAGGTGGNSGLRDVRSNKTAIGGVFGNTGVSPYDGAHVLQDHIVGISVNGTAPTNNIISGNLKVTVWWYDVDPANMTGLA